MARTRDPVKELQYQRTYRSKHKEEISQYHKAYHLKHRDERLKRYRDYNVNLRWRDDGRRIEITHGLEEGQYLEMLREQSGKCFICGRYPRSEVSTRRLTGTVRNLHVDHDHETGAIRKLLCHRCNLMLGYVRDDIMLLEKMIDYIRKFREEPPNSWRTALPLPAKVGSLRSE